ncbi:Putative glutamine amidotransferase OS=Ureibacillus acetophenoni OX=614649 GN=SAMN05877842_1257 PE=4 SV=1 [Ureibacillus acetophenoni]
MDLRINDPIALLLFIPLIAYFFWVWWRHKNQFKTNHFIVFAIRGVSIILIVFALSSPYLLLPIKDEQVIFLIDRSASLNGTESGAVSFIEESLKNKKEQHSVGIYSFALGFQTESLLSKNLEQIPTLSEITDKSDTNIEEALQIAVSVADRGKATRIVLLSDGLETKGNVANQLIKLAGTNVSIDVLPIERPVTSDVSIQSFVTPQIAYAGEQQQLNIEVVSTKATEGILYLYENDQLIKQETVTLDEGTNMLEELKG